MKNAHGPVLAALLVVAAAAAALAQPGKQGDRAPRQISVFAAPIPSFNRSEPERTRFGALEFLGGLVLEANDERFGGLSGLRILNDENEFVAISDRAHWIRGRLILDGRRPVGVEDAEIAAMLDGSGAVLSTSPSFDTEALALGHDNEFYVGIERTHRIVRFDFGKRGVFSLARDVKTPRGMRNLPSNQGIEGLVFVPRNRPLAGSLIAFSERALDRNGNLRAFIIGGKTPGEFAVRRSNEFDITDAALIPGGDILILERYFSWLRGVGMRIRLIRLADVRPGALVDGATLIEVGNAHEIDNMEGIAAQKTADGQTVITVVSDDNFSRLQRTLLLRFALVED